MPDNAVDVAIIGTGPVGCALALALQGSGLRVALVGRFPANTDSDISARGLRPLALSYASRLILERIGAWQRLTTTPIEEIHVSQSGGFGRTRLSGKDLDLPALGYVSGYAEVAAHLANAIDPGTRWAPDAPSPKARLSVHAEGATRAQAPARDYGHSAISALVETDRPAHNVAWERFTAEGPLALLPFGSRYGLVWSRTNASAPAEMASDDGQFLAGLQDAFGRRAGRFVKIGPRATTPLVLRYRTQAAVAGEVHIGNAAQTLHPVAGQGLNLGLRDAWDLAGLLSAAPPDSIGSPAFADKFARVRRLDALATIRATDLLATLYVRRDRLSSAVRGAALAALDIFPPARKAFARRMVYGASAW